MYLFAIDHENIIIYNKFVKSHIDKNSNICDVKYITYTNLVYHSILDGGDSLKKLLKVLRFKFFFKRGNHEDEYKDEHFLYDKFKHLRKCLKQH